MQALSALHEGLIRGLSLALGNHLNAAVEVKLTGMEELPFLQLTTQLPPNPYVSSLEFQSQQSLGALQIDLSLAFPALDLMLGGTGVPQPITRGLSEIEISLMEDVSRIGGF